MKTNIGEIRIFSRDEKKQDDMRHHFQATHIGQYAKSEYGKYALAGEELFFGYAEKTAANENSSL